MLSRFATVINNAVDALAPPIPLQEEFVYHWNAITSFFVDKKSDSKAPVEETNIPAHLRQMLSILSEEESGLEQGATGPCMEYVLHHKLLDTMQTLGRADCPPGMKQHVLGFFSQLLTKFNQPLLPHVSVHRPVQRLVRMCGEVKAAPTEYEEVQFLCILCAKLKDSPHLVSFFLEGKKNSFEAGDSKASSSKQQQLENSAFEFPLVVSLLTLSQSADHRVAMKACEGLILCTSLSDELCARSIVEKTPFCQVLVDRLVQLHSSLPRAVDPSFIEVVEAKWGLDTFDFEEDFMMFPGKRQLMSFLAWIDYCDQLTKEAHPCIGAALGCSISENWFTKIMLTQLTEGSDKELALATCYLTRFLHLVSSEVLVTEVAKFLLGDHREPEIPGIVPHVMKQKFFDHCSLPPNMLSLMSLKLLEALMEKTNEHAIHNLVLANLLSRDYYDNSLPDHHDSWSDEEDDRVRRGLYDADVSPGSSPISRTLAPTNIHKIINCFLLLLPDELKSSDGEDDDDTGYENYLQDAHRQFREVAMACASFDWPREAVSCEEQNVSDCSSAESQAEAESVPMFYEGSFLKMIFDKLENMLSQPYEISLQVTSLVSKLALLPHPYLHEFLLNPLVPHSDGARTLFSVLEKVVSNINAQIHNVPGFKHKLHAMRKQLLGDSQDLNSDDDTDGFLEGIIVLEEFCKELAAIAFVKYHASS